MSFSTGYSPSSRGSEMPNKVEITLPNAVGRYLGDANREKANCALQAMLKMKKIVVADLDKAFKG